MRKALILLLSVLAAGATTCLVSEMHMYFNTEAAGIPRASTSENYGLAFDNLIVTLGAFIGLLIYFCYFFEQKLPAETQQEDNK